MKLQRSGLSALTAPRKKLKVVSRAYEGNENRVSGLPATAETGRIKASHRRRWKAGVGSTRYANNNPYRFTDPDGRQSRDFESISKQAGTYLKTPPPSEKDWLGPAIGVALTAILAAPVAAEGGMYMLATPGTFATATNIAAEAAGVTGTAAGAGLLAREAAGVLQPAGKLIGQAGSSSQIRLLQGGQAEAGQLFQQLSKGGEAVEGANYSGALMRIGEEATVGLRPTSKSGPPTIDVNIPGLNIREIKFIDDAK